MAESLIHRHSEALMVRHGDRVWRIGLDGGFSCPHRSQGRGAGGCSYCGPQAGRALYLPEGEASIGKQVEAELAARGSRQGSSRRSDFNRDELY